MTPAEIIIKCKSPESDNHFVVAKIYIRSDGNARTNIDWLQKAIDKLQGSNPYALASEIMITGGDMWLTCFPLDNEVVDCTWEVKWNDRNYRWEIFPPDSMYSEKEQAEFVENMDVWLSRNKIS